MTQPFADALTWVPRSRALGTTLSQANDLARARSHGVVTLEHLLQALLDDADARPVLAACRIDFDLVGQDVSDYLRSLPTSDEPLPVADPHLLRILEYAVAAAQQSRRREVTGAIVLAAIVGEGKSKAAELLQQRGLTFPETVRALQQSAAQRPSTAGTVPATAAATVQGREAVSAEPSPAQPQTAAPAPRAGDVPAELPPEQDRAPAEEPARDAAGEERRDEASSTDKPVPGGPSASGWLPRQRAQEPRYQGADDEDPITTARRRIAAARGGVPLPPVSPRLRNQAEVLSQRSTVERATPVDPAVQPPREAREHGFGAEIAASAAVPASPIAPPMDSESWVPPHRPQHGASTARMPPPLPPLASGPAIVARFPAAGSVSARISEQGDVGPVGAGMRPGGAPSLVPAAPATAAPSAAPAPWHEPQVAIAAKVHPQPVQPYDAEGLADFVPERIWVGQQVTVEVRIPRAALPSIGLFVDRRMGVEVVAGGRQSNTVEQIAVSIALKSQGRDLCVEPLAPETQWLDNRIDPMLDDEAVWRWALTPLRTGTAKLRLVVEAHKMDREGLMIQARFPDQDIDVRIAANLKSSLLPWAGWIGAGIVGAILWRFLGEGLWGETLAMLARLTSQ